jgi:hypothetical protein
VRGPWRILVVIAGAAVAVALFFVLRGGDDEETASPARTGTTATRTTQTRPVPPRRPRPLFVKLEVENGRAVGGIRRISVPRGRRITILVESDVADEVHVHGYDLKRMVAAGRSAGITFTASTPGRFEIELEGPHLQLAELSVQP